MNLIKRLDCNVHRPTFCSLWV